METWPGNNKKHEGIARRAKGIIGAALGASMFAALEDAVAKTHAGASEPIVACAAGGEVIVRGERPASPDALAVLRELNKVALGRNGHDEQIAHIKTVIAAFVQSHHTIDGTTIVHKGLNGKPTFVTTPSYTPYGELDAVLRKDPAVIADPEVRKIVYDTLTAYMVTPEATN